MRVTQSPSSSLLPLSLPIVVHSATLPPVEERPQPLGALERLTRHRPFHAMPRSGSCVRQPHGRRVRARSAFADAHSSRVSRRHPDTRGLVGRPRLGRCARTDPCRLAHRRRPAHALVRGAVGSISSSLRSALRGRAGVDSTTRRTEVAATSRPRAGRCCLEPRRGPMDVRSVGTRRGTGCLGATRRRCARAGCDRDSRPKRHRNNPTGGGGDLRHRRAGSSARSFYRQSAVPGERTADTLDRAREGSRTARFLIR